MLVFRLGTVTCGVNAEAVREILPAQPATPVPGAAAEVAGLMNVRGTLVTVVDGRRAVGPSPADRNGSVVLLDLGPRLIGLIVDEVLDLVSLRVGELTSRRDLPGVDARVVQAVGRWRDESFVLLDLDTLLGPILGR